MIVFGVVGHTFLTPKRLAFHRLVMIENEDTQSDENRSHSITLNRGYLMVKEEVAKSPTHMAMVRYPIRNIILCVYNVTM